MVSNRLLDRGIDARNPRTVSRALPAGRVAVWQVRAALLAASAAFVMLCGLFGVLQQNWWPLALALPVLFWICSYGLFKRFTMLCHVWLGASLAISPVAAALAVRPAAVLESGPWLLAGAVLFWVAGFDVLYAMQDVEVDRRDGLHSMPARMGVQRAAWASRVMHVASVMLLVAFWRAEPALCAGTGFAAAVVVAAVVIASEHVLLARGGAAGIAKHFTTLNGIVSLALGGAGIASIIAARG
jgi:4-hydroxybenzoate polyprenyltransferase